MIWQTYIYVMLTYPMHIYNTSEHSQSSVSGNRTETWDQRLVK